MITILIFIAAFCWIVLMSIQKYGGELIINPIIGFMVGWLYDSEEEYGVTNHTIQVLLGVICFTIVWETYE
jgi:hypothetical protein